MGKGQWKRGDERGSEVGEGGSEDRVERERERARRADQHHSNFSV